MGLCKISLLSCFGSFWVILCEWIMLTGYAPWYQLHALECSYWYLCWFDKTDIWRNNIAGEVADLVYAISIRQYLVFIVWKHSYHLMDWFQQQPNISAIIFYAVSHKSSWSELNSSPFSNRISDTALRIHFQHKRIHVHACLWW